MTEFVIFTGFEPFGIPRPPTNPSWEAVKQLAGKKIEVKGQDNSIKEIIFDTEEIPVEYGPILNKVPEFHQNTDKTYKYYIHVGRGHDHQISIETLAHKKGYYLRDNVNQLPDGGICPAYDIEEIKTEVDVKCLVEHLCNQKGWKEICQSDDAGRYLCEYTFYISLCENFKKSNPGKVLFVHVPSENRPYSIDQLSQILEDIGVWVAENY
ncbi:42964_t:CDS:2 [Gigaspora margarita]|uniref:Peptidase C15, pyroglutamyl peptidase I-like protein n=2 Tax=Gigaspora margarita TaxID=4874 RepID=A0A8H4ESK4_GIGMA|nr:peptidase C15, pyroglutamyl peptidase I-like protein [Gigaspora margarita]CAG8497281.1 42964_t:CDS:2 [Gigaspora margarita]